MAPMLFASGRRGKDRRFPQEQGPFVARRRLVELNLKQAGNVEKALMLVKRADVLIEGYRPGVMERLGLGPKICHRHNAALVYGRMTGWGQQGPLAQRAGHDIDYIALTGALDALERNNPARCRRLT